MIFNNVNNLQVVDDFEEAFGAILEENFPELTDCKIRIYTDREGDGFIKKYNDRDNSPYTSNHVVREIMRSEDVFNVCGFNRDEEFAIIAHELGHFVAGVRGEKSAINIEEEKRADEMTAFLGLDEAMISAIRKMIDLNIHPENKAEMEERINHLRQI